MEVPLYKLKMQDCLDVFLLSGRKKLQQLDLGASFRASTIMLMLTWRCNYINCGSYNLYNNFYKTYVLHLQDGDTLEQVPVPCTAMVQMTGHQQYSRED